MAIADALPEWAVYTAPPAQVAAPAVVIAPRAPYRRRVDYRREEVRLQLTVLLPHVTGKDGLELLDNALQSVLAAVEQLDMVTWESVDSVGPTVEVGGLTYLAATIGVVAYLEGDS